MSSPFDQSIFGPVVEKKPSPQLETNSKAFKSFPSGPQSTDYNSTKSSSNPPKYKNQVSLKYQQATYSTTNSENSSRAQYPRQAASRKLLSGNIENSSLAEGITNILKQVKLKKVTGDDNFYCSCNENQDKNINHICVACGGKGGVDGTHNMVKFIQYIMEFKLRLKGTYKNNNSAMETEEKKQEQQIKQNTSIFQKNINKTKSIIILSKVNSKQNNNNKINDFCTQYIKDQYKTQDNSQCNNKSKQFNTTKKTIQTNQSTQMTNNQSYIGGINLGMNSMTQSINNFTQLSQSNSKNNQLDQQNQNQNQDGEKSKSFMNQKQNTSSAYEKDESQSKDQFYGGPKYNKNSNNKIRKIKVGCFTRSIYEQCQNIDEQQISRPKIIDGRKSLPAQSFMNLHDFKAKLQQKNNIHTQYSCDICEVSPIKGSRYHCTSLMCQNDYDLCQKCYLKVGHKHKMEQIKYNYVNQLCQGLDNMSSKLVRSSLKISAGIIGKYRQDEDNKIQQEYQDEYYKPIFKSSIH